MITTLPIHVTSRLVFLLVSPMSKQIGNRLTWTTFCQINSAEKGECTWWDSRHQVISFETINYPKYKYKCTQTSTGERLTLMKNSKQSLAQELFFILSRHGQFSSRLRVAKILITLTFRIPIDVANPGAALSPFSRGKGISPWFEMSILTPASSTKAPIYSSCSIFNSRFNPMRKVKTN